MGPRVLRCFCAVGLRFVRYLRGFGLKSVLLKRLPADCPFLANPWPRILYVFLSFLIEIALNHCPMRIAHYLRGFGRLCHFVRVLRGFCRDALLQRNRMFSTCFLVILARRFILLCTCVVARLLLAVHFARVFWPFGRFSIHIDCLKIQ